MDIQKIEQHVKGILEAIGEDPNREGLVETPKRVAKAFAELFANTNVSNEELAKKYNKCFEHCKTNDLVILKNIPLNSTCEHHLIWFHGVAHVAYIPNGKVIGLSKIPRIVKAVSQRLQLQERITKDIADVLSRIVGTENIMVITDCRHGCVEARGVGAVGNSTTSSHVGGLFKENLQLRHEALGLLGLK